MSDIMERPVRLEPRVEALQNGRALQIWDLGRDQAKVESFLTYVFERYWDSIIFGPMIEGAAYELTCPCPPTRIGTFDGYLTVSFGGPHFHLCIGETKGGTAEECARRQPSEARIFRRLDKTGAPISWGFDMKNGAGEPMISIFFSSPFLEAGDKIAKTPDWSRLAMWRDISARFLGRDPESFDESGHGFRGDGHG